MAKIKLKPNENMDDIVRQLAQPGIMVDKPPRHYPPITDRKRVPNPNSRRSMPKRSGREGRFFGE